MRSQGCLCVQDLTHMPGNTLQASYFQGLISKKLDTAVYHKETLHKCKTFQKFEKKKIKVKQKRLTKQQAFLKKINLPFVCSDLANICLFSLEKGHYPMNP